MFGYYTTDELARRLRCTKKRLDCLRKSGMIPASACIFRGSEILYKAGPVDGMIEDGTLGIPDNYLHEPMASELIVHENLALLPEHHERYLRLYETRTNSYSPDEIRLKSHEITRRFTDSEELESNRIFLPENVFPANSNEVSIVESIETHQFIQINKGEDNLMVETYTVKELAKKIGVPWQTVAAWKRFGTIPDNAIQVDGSLKKSVIDKLIDDGTLKASSAPKKAKKASPPPPPEKQCRCGPKRLQAVLGRL